MPTPALGSPLPARASAIRILLIDGDDLIRAGLRALLESWQGLQVIGEAANCTDARTAAEERPDIILLNHELRGGLEGLPELLAATDGARLLVLAGEATPDTHQRAIRLGAMGLVPKRKPADVLIRAIEKVHAGEVWFDRTAIAGVLADMARPKAAQTDPEAEKITQLTKREREVVALVAEGLKNKQIAERLFISSVTVRHHLTSIFSKLGVTDRLELMIYAFRNNLAERPL